MSSETPRIPYDVLEVITAAYVELEGTTLKYGREGGRVISNKDLWPLSLVCRDLNEICGRYIFQDYHLTLRTPRNYMHSPKLTERDEEVGFDAWNEEAVRERIKHFADRSHCTRMLTITSRGDNKAESFPAVIVPLLVEAISRATRLESITLKCGGNVSPLPKPIWEALREHNLSVVDIEGLRPPLDAPSPMPTVKRLCIEWRKPVKDFMEVRL